MVDYFKDFLPFGRNQRFPKDDILGLVEFALPCEWQKHLIIQEFDSAGKSFKEIVEFCKHIETTEEIFND